MGRPRKTPEGKLYRAKQGFSTDIDGVPTAIQAGELVREGHPLLLGRSEMFEPIIVQHEWEQATAAPGEYRERGKTYETSGGSGIKT